MINHFLSDRQQIHTCCREACKTMVVICSECSKTFHNKSNLNRHKATMHSENEEEEEEMDSDNDSEDESENEEEDNAWIIDIWDVIRNKAESTNRSLKKVYKDYVLLVKSFKHDEIHQKVMETVKRAQDEDEMDFLEALEYAISKRTFLINRQATNGTENNVVEEEEENDEDSADDENEMDT